MLPYPTEESGSTINTEDINSNRKRFLQILTSDKERFYFARETVNLSSVLSGRESGDLTYNLMKKLNELGNVNFIGNLANVQLTLVNDTEDILFIPNTLESIIGFKFNEAITNTDNLNDAYRFTVNTLAIGAQYLKELDNSILQQDFNDLSESEKILYKNELVDKTLKAPFEVAENQTNLSENGYYQNGFYIYPMNNNVAASDIILRPKESAVFSLSLGDRYVHYITNFNQNASIGAFINIPIKKFVGELLNIKFQFEDGKVESFEVIKDTGNNITPPIIPQKEGYRIVGWVDESGRSFTDYESFNRNATFTPKYESISPPSEDVTISFKFEDGKVESFEVIKDSENNITQPIIPQKEGYRIVGWVDESGRSFNDYDSFNRNITFTPKYENISPPSEDVTISFRFEDGKVQSFEVIKDSENNITPPIIPQKEGYRVVGWVDERGRSFNDYESFNRNITFIPKYDRQSDPFKGNGMKEESIYGNIIFSPSAREANLHNAYIKGYPDGTFQPKEGLDRGEYATIIARLARMSNIRAENEPLVLSDVSLKDYYYRDLNYVTALGYFRGYPDGTFKG